MTGRLALTILDMLRFRSGPQDMPAGWVLVITLAFAYAVQGMVADRMLGDTDGSPRSLVAIGVQFGLTALVLNARSLQSRLPQTLSALAGTGFIIGLLALVLLSQVEPDKQQPELALLYLMLFGWSLAVDAHIYRHALSVAYGIGAMMAVLIFAANFILLRTLFG